MDDNEDTLFLQLTYEELHIISVALVMYSNIFMVIQTIPHSVMIEPGEVMDKIMKALEVQKGA